MMGRALAGLLFLLAMSSGLLAAEPVARIKVLTPSPIVAGQQVELQVDVLVPNYFLSAPKFPLFDLPNAIVTLPDTGAVNLTETIGGESYAGIRRTYLVTPQAPGDFAVPQVKISFSYAAVPGQASAGTVTLPAQSFTVTGGPAGAGAAAAARITVTQDIDRDPKSLKAGDTLVRIVTIKAEGLQAMMIPVPQFEAPESVRLYPHDPVLTDNLDPRNGPVGGVRIDKVTYAFAKAGSYALPAIEIAWFDPRTQKHETVEAPAITVKVVDAAGVTDAIKPPDETAEAPPPHPVPWAAIGRAAEIFAALALLLWLLPRLWGVLRDRRQARRRRYEQSEAYAFRQFSKACRTGTEASVYRALQSWAARCKATPLRGRLDGSALQEYERLEARLFAGAPGPFDGVRLLSGIAAERRKWLGRERLISAPALPPLNP